MMPRVDGNARRQACIHEMNLIFLRTMAVSPLVLDVECLHEVLKHEPVGWNRQLIGLPDIMQVG